MMVKKSILGLLVAFFVLAPCEDLLGRHGGGRFGGGHSGGRRHGGYHGHRGGWRGGWGHTYVYDDFGVGLGLVGSAVVASALISADNRSPSTNNLRDDILTLNKYLNDATSDIKVLSERINGLLNRMERVEDRIASLEASAKK